MTDYAKIRMDYQYSELISVEQNPFEQLELWLHHAIAAQLKEPHAMTLSTAHHNRPSSRVVLLRKLSVAGLVFFSNYTSRKGEELDSNPHACLNFWWAELERQVRIEGVVHKIPEEASDAYFASRPRGSQIGAWASPQSREVQYEHLMSRVEELEIQFPETVPRPQHWGGYCLVPHYFEFWQGRPSRLHDRWCYQQQPEAWRIARLAP